MKKILSSVCGGAALLTLLTGCDPDLAQIPAGSQEEFWYQQLKENYSSFTPPRTPAPAAYSRPAAPAPVTREAEKPVDDPENAVDRAAGGENVNAAAAADAKADSKDAKADAKDAKADAKADAKDAKADVKAEEKVAGKPYIVQKDDTLGGIAKRFYGKSSMEDVLFKANSKVIKDRNKLHPGMRLVIPEL